MGCTRVWRLAGIGAVTALALAACGDDGATVSLKTPTDGAAVAGAVELVMAADGITIEEAGEARDGAGHFHVIADDGCVATGEPVPKDADHVHFGSGASTGSIYLEPGEHELCLQAADGVHNALAVTDTISVNVGVDSLDDWCIVVGQIDELFTETDNSDDDFAVKQLGYENITRLIAQAVAGAEHIDATARDDVLTSIDVADALASTFANAADEFAVADEVTEIFTTRGDDMELGAPYIADTCGIDVNG